MNFGGFQEGYLSVEHFKRYTTTGMGIDQGKTGNINALALLAKETGSLIEDVGTTTYRPPFTPVTFGALSGGRVENLYKPLPCTCPSRARPCAARFFKRERFLNYSVLF